MSIPQYIGDEYEHKVSGFNSPRVLISNEAGKNQVLIRIDMQGPLQNACIIPPVHPNEEGVASEVHLTSGTILIQIDRQAVPPGHPQVPTFQQNASGIPVAMVSPEASPAPLPAPNDNQVQADGTPAVQAVSNDNAPNGGELIGLIATQQVAAPNHIVGETEIEMLLYRQKMTESSLLIAAQVFVTLLTAWLGNNNHPLSPNMKILWDFAVGSTIVGYVSSFSSILMCKLSTGFASRILNTIAYAGAAFGFIASMGMLLPDELKLWISFLGCAVCFPALAAGFRS
ncbi:conserved hypothetical protein [Ricinus communis]|uniref:Uncharacterized protein n=1 Tax=Ricinus communis TaxID=3988 RepID=B9SX64_RICCO|nr:conserved hypothetical protein [Ricinus communis]|eukprot:XP_002530583.1 uncharacterized protein LOC8269779 [Ricinus communis]